MKKSTREDAARNNLLAASQQDILNAWRNCLVESLIAGILCKIIFDYRRIEGTFPSSPQQVANAVIVDLKQHFLTSCCDVLGVLL